MIKDPVKIAIKDVYYGMIRRCYDIKDKRYANYGGRGVQVCAEWRVGISVFRDWALRNGWEKGLQLDKDILGDGMLYGPETCCFVTPKKNSNNKTSSVKYEYKGEMLTLAEISEKVGLKYKTLHRRVVTSKVPLNIAVSAVLGSKVQGKNKCISKKDILYIFNSSLSYTKLARKYGMSISFIASIKHGSSYSYLTGKVYNAVARKDIVMPMGEQNKVSKLKEEQVIEIKELFQSGKHVTWLARKYKVHHMTISKITRGISWKHVSIRCVSPCLKK